MTIFQKIVWIKNFTIKTVNHETWDRRLKWQAMKQKKNNRHKQLGTHIRIVINAVGLLNFYLLIYYRPHNNNHVGFSSFYSKTNCWIQQKEFRYYWSRRNPWRVPEGDGNEQECCKDRRHPKKKRISSHAFNYLSVDAFQRPLLITTTTTTTTITIKFMFTYLACVP